MIKIYNKKENIFAFLIDGEYQCIHASVTFLFQKHNLKKKRIALYM